jgi:hypothetical protein
MRVITIERRGGDLTANEILITILLIFTSFLAQEFEKLLCVSFLSVSKNSLQFVDSKVEREKDKKS